MYKTISHELGYLETKKYTYDNTKELTKILKQAAKTDAGFKGGIAISIKPIIHTGSENGNKYWQGIGYTYIFVPNKYNPYRYFCGYIDLKTGKVKEDI